MFNTLGHFGLQGIVSRLLFRRVDLRWILLGSVLPAVPQLLAAVAPPLDVHTLRLYFVAQGSLLGSLLLAAAIAAVARRPRVVFGVLVFNVVLAMVLEACVTRWSNGVAFAAPLSWRLVSFELFWPESPILDAAAWLGVGFLAWASRHGLFAPLRITLRRWPLVLLLLAAWVTLPLPMSDSAYAAGVHDAKTLRNEVGGRPVVFDRTRFDDALHPWDGRSYRLWPAPKQPSLYSVRGVFAVPGEIVVEEIHDHGEPGLELAAIAGWTLLAGSVLVGLVRGRRQPSEC